MPLILRSSLWDEVELNEWRVEQAMSEIDVIKEQIAYLKVWLGIMVITDISLFGWLITHFDRAPSRIVVGCILAVIAVSAGIVLIHRRIERHIESLRSL